MLRSLIVLSAALALGACGDADAPAADTATTDAAVSDAVVGPNSTPIMDYEGRLADGTVFDSNENVPMPMPMMVPGFRDAVVGLSAGDTKTFDIAPEDAYGAQGRPPVIPPNATLTFDVTVHSVQ